MERVAGGDDGAHARATDEVDGNSRFLDCLDHADVGDAACAAASQYEANATASEAAGEAFFVAEGPDPDVVVVRDVPAAEPLRRAARLRGRGGVDEDELSPRRELQRGEPLLDRARHGAGCGVGDEEDPVGPAQAAFGPDVPLRTRVEKEVPGAVLELAERDVGGEAQGSGERSLGRTFPSVAFVEAGCVESERVPEGNKALGERPPEGEGCRVRRQREDREREAARRGPGIGGASPGGMAVHLALGDDGRDFQ